MNKVLVNTLIDKATEVVGSNYKLGKLIGVSPQAMSDWKHHRRPCPPEDMALMAAAAGFDAEAWLIRGLLEKHAGTAKGERLAVALGKGSPATTEASGSSGQHPGPTGRPESGLPRCILC